MFNFDDGRCQIIKYQIQNIIDTYVVKYFHLCSYGYYN